MIDIPGLIELHLLEYHKAELEYLKAFAARNLQESMRNGAAFAAFSEPWDSDNYNDNSITDQLITDLYLHFNKHTRCDESQDYLRTLKG